jgi:Tfp pilus assembly protein PilN
MRPVNLIPPEDRRGVKAPSRTGAIPYAILAMLAVVLFAVAAVTLTNKQISDKKAEKSQLEAQQADAQARADALAPYAQFADTANARVQTVSQLAESRFDWVRVLKELSLVLPGDVWLTDLSGSANPSVQAATGGGSGLTEGLAVPTLVIEGCATGHDAVAAFVETLKDIDGVTRVGVESSERGDDSSSSGSGGSSNSPGADCQTRSFIAKFSITVAFDSASVPASASVPPTTDAATAPDQVADGQAQEQQARDSAAEQTDKARNATDIIPGVAR